MTSDARDDDQIAAAAALDFALVDLHAHLEGELSVERALQIAQGGFQSRRKSSPLEMPPVGVAGETESAGNRQPLPDHAGQLKGLSSDSREVTVPNGFQRNQNTILLHPVRPVVPSIPVWLINNNAFQAQMEALLEVLEHGGTHPLNDRSARADHEIVMSIYESARRRARIDLPLDVLESPLEAMVAAGEV